MAPHNQPATQTVKIQSEVQPSSRPRIRSTLTWLIVTMILIACVSPWLLGPRCPTRIVIATGQPEGAYFSLASELSDALAEHGIKLEVRSTAGSVENLELLQTDADVSLAIVQGGVDSPALTATSNVTTTSNIESLASLYQEPVWLFHSARLEVEQLSDLQGKRIGVGNRGSGVASVARCLLRDNELISEDISSGETEYYEIGMTDAHQGLQTGELDAAFFVISPDSPIIASMLRDEDLALFNFHRANAYQQRHPCFSIATLPEGVLDFRSNIPGRDRTLLAPTANLVAREDFHHALIPLVLEAIQEIRGDRTSLLDSSASFPSPLFVDFPLNGDARRYFETGPSLLYRYLPFSVAAWLDRVKLILLPMLTLLFPLLKVAPPVYRWRIRSKIFRWYRVLHDIDQGINLAIDQGANFADRGQAINVASFSERIDRLESELFEVSVPLSYMEEFYNLRLHVAYVRNKLARQKSPRRLKAA